MSKEDLVQHVKNALDPDNYQGIDVLENITIHDDLETVSITFKVIKVPEDNYVGLVGY